VTRLLLLRHGLTTWNAAGRWQGWADAPLTDTGREQARRAAAALAGEGFEVIVASDLGRARETAEIMAALLGGLPVAIEEGLRERDVGQWSGLTSAEIDARWPGQLGDWRAGQLDVIPGGEGDIGERVVAAVGSLVVSHPGRTLLAVTHGGVIRTMERHLGVEPAGVGNLAGRWVEESGGTLRAGPSVTLLDSDVPAPRTTVL
jgi:broad specificity phosphatase PhoE